MCTCGHQRVHHNQTRAAACTLCACEYFTRENPTWADDRATLNADRKARAVAFERGDLKPPPHAEGTQPNGTFRIKKEGTP